MCRPIWRLGCWRPLRVARLRQLLSWLCSHRSVLLGAHSAARPRPVRNPAPLIATAPRDVLSQGGSCEFFARLDGTISRAAPSDGTKGPGTEVQVMTISASRTPHPGGRADCHPVRQARDREAGSHPTEDVGSGRHHSRGGVSWTRSLSVHNGRTIL